MNRGNAHTLWKVVPIAEKQEAGGITVALSALELYEGGGGILRYLVSYDSQKMFGDPFRGIPEPEIEVRDGSGRSCGWAPDAASGGENEVEGTLELYDLPGSGELEIRVARVVSTEPPDGAVSESHEGPWSFHLSL